MANTQSFKKLQRQSVKRINVIIERFWWIALIAAAVVTCVIIMLLARGQSIWFDEGYSIYIAHKPVGELLALTAVDAHPPFYYLLLKAWAGVFGWSEFALRSLSAVAAAVSVGVMIALIRRLFNARIALIVMPFLVLSPFFLRYGYEVRMYALVGLIGVVATWVLVRALQSRRVWWWIGYAALVALGMYTLYMSLVIWLAHVVWLLVRTLRDKQSIIKQKWFFAYVIAVGFFVPYLPTFLDQTSNSALPGIGGPLTIEKLSGVLGLLVSFTPSWQIGGVLSIGLLTMVGLGVYIGVSVWKKLNKTTKTRFGLFLSLAGVPLLFYIVVSLLPKPFFIDRYMAHVSLFIYVLLGLLVALGFAHGKRVSAVVLAMLSLVLLGFGVWQLQQSGNVNFERLQKPMTLQLRQSIDCADAVVIADDPYTYIDSIYYFDGCDVRFVGQDPAPTRGGYAPLLGSSARITSLATFDRPTLYYLRWEGHEHQFQPDSRYQFVSTETFDKQIVDRFELSAE